MAQKYAAECAGLTADEAKARTTAGELETGDDGKPAMRRWSLKTIRKAGATAIGNHPTDARFAPYYLGRAPDTVAATHYVRPSEEQFRDCLKWLGESFRVDTADKIGPPKRQDAGQRADGLTADRVV